MEFSQSNYSVKYRNNFSSLFSPSQTSGNTDVRGLYWQILVSDWLKVTSPCDLLNPIWYCQIRNVSKHTRGRRTIKFKHICLKHIFEPRCEFLCLFKSFKFYRKHTIISTCRRRQRYYFNSLIFSLYTVATFQKWDNRKHTIYFSPDIFFDFKL